MKYLLTVSTVYWGLKRYCYCVKPAHRGNIFFLMLLFLIQFSSLKSCLKVQGHFKGILLVFKDSQVSLKEFLGDFLTLWTNHLPSAIRGIRQFDVPPAVIGTPFILYQPGNWGRLKEQAMLCSWLCSVVLWQSSDHLNGDAYVFACLHHT